MTFTPSIPIPGQSLGNSRPQVAGNFANYRATMEVNHVDVNAADAGKHKFMQMPAQGSPPTTAAGESALYTQTNNAGTPLYLRTPSNGDSIGFNVIKGSSVVTVATPTALIDLNSPVLPNFVGFIEARINTATNLFAVAEVIYWFNGIAMLGKLVKAPPPTFIVTPINNASAPTNGNNGAYLDLAGTVVQVNLLGLNYVLPNYTVTFTITQFLVPA